MTEDLARILTEIMLDLVRQHGSQKSVAMKLGIDEGNFSRKYSQQEGWTSKDIAAILSLGGYTVIKSEELQALKVFAKKGLG